MGSTISALGFLGKEVATVLLQPRLVASLVLGPFLIMVAFGLGYRGPHPEFRTILVIPPSPRIAEKVDLSAIYREGLSGVFDLREVTSDREAALAKLRADEADVVVVVPPDLYEQVYGGHQAALTVYYAETDPTSNGWVRYFTAEQTAQLNRRLLVEMLARTKEPVAEALAFSEHLLDDLDALEAEIEAQDYPGASARADRLFAETRQALSDVGRDLDSLNDALGGDPVRRERARQLLLEIDLELAGLRNDLDDRSADAPALLARVRAARDRAGELHAIAKRIDSVPVEVLVSPLTASAQNVAPVAPSAVAFYTPAVLALLLQHIGVTLASLSAVRDRLLGSLELYRISPTNAGEILVGKALGYGLVMAAVGAALTAALIAFLSVPLLGSPYLYALAVGLVIYGSVGLGFALAVVARTESQAVQLSMLVLLTSVFFGGFFLPIDLLFGWIRSVSYVLPVTYGAINLRDLMLRGSTPAWQTLLAPFLLGAVFYGVGLLGLRQQMARGGGT